MPSESPCAKQGCRARQHGTCDPAQVSRGSCTTSAYPPVSRTACGGWALAMAAPQDTVNTAASRNRCAREEIRRTGRCRIIQIRGVQTPAGRHEAEAPLLLCCSARVWQSTLALPIGRWEHQSYTFSTERLRGSGTSSGARYTARGTGLRRFVVRQPMARRPSPSGGRPLDSRAGRDLAAQPH